MKNNNPKINFLYNIIYQIMVIIIPLITAPYIARVIGPKGSGINSYTTSIAYYFVIFGMLGINNYGNRLIAKVRDDKVQLNKEFTSLFIMHTIVSIISLIAYLTYIFFFTKEYQIYFIIQTIYVFSVIFDINWFFHGLEQFKITVTRNIIIKIITTFCIFIFIKKYDDLWLYILIVNLSMFISQISLFPFLKKCNIKFVKVSKKEIFKHFKPLLILFLPTFAFTLYRSMDKIMLEYFVNVSEVGLYEYAERIVTLPNMLIIALGTVMLPKISNLIAKKDENQTKKYIDKSIEFVIFLSIAMAIGLIIISNNFIPIFLGNSYKKSIYLLEILAISLPFIALSHTIQTQYLIPKEKDKEYIIALCIGAIINLILNSILIPNFEAIGACIATIIAEFSVLIYELNKIKKDLNIKKYIKLFFLYLIKGIIMGIIIYSINYIKFNNMYKLIIKVIIGVIAYCLLNINYINNIINIKNIIKKIGVRNG